MCVYFSYDSNDALELFLLWKDAAILQTKSSELTPAAIVTEAETKPTTITLHHIRNSRSHRILWLLVSHSYFMKKGPRKCFPNPVVRCRRRSWKYPMRLKPTNRGPICAHLHRLARYIPLEGHLSLRMGIWRLPRVVPSLVSDPTSVSKFWSQLI